MALTIEAQKLLSELELGYRKAAFYPDRYRFGFEETIGFEELSLCSDSWNSGRNSRILIPAGAKIRCVSSVNAYAVGVYGPDCNKLQGLWVSEFSYSEWSGVIYKA